MANIVIYTTGYCPYCLRARELLDKKGVKYTDIRIDEEPEKRQEMVSKSKRNTVPQIFINDQAIGGCDALYALEEQGELDKLLEN